MAVSESSWGFDALGLGRCRCCFISDALIARGIQYGLPLRIDMAAYMGQTVSPSDFYA